MANNTDLILRELLEVTELIYHTEKLLLKFPNDFALKITLRQDKQRQNELRDNYWNKESDEWQIVPK